MADFTKTVELIFGGKDNVSPTVRDITKSLDSLESGVGKVAAPLADVADVVIKVDAALAAMAATMVGVAINEASKFQSAFNEISTLFETTPDAIGQFSTDIRAFASTSTQSIDDINASVYAAISAGISYADSLDFLRVAEQAAVAGGGDLESTTKVLVSALNAYGASADRPASSLMRCSLRSNSDRQHFLNWRLAWVL